MPLQLAVALAVGTLVHGGVGLVGAYLNTGQAAVIHILTVVGAVGDTAFDGGVGVQLQPSLVQFLLMIRSSRKIESGAKPDSILS